MMENTGVEQMEITFPVSSGRSNSRKLPFATTISCCFGPEKFPEKQSCMWSQQEKSKLTETLPYIAMLIAEDLCKLSASKFIIKIQAY